MAERNREGDVPPGARDRDGRLAPSLPCSKPLRLAPRLSCRDLAALSGAAGAAACVGRGGLGDGFSAKKSGSWLFRAVRRGWKGLC